MLKRTAIVFCVFVFALNISAWGGQPSSKFTDEIVTVWVEQQHDVVAVGGESAMAIHFELKENWHFYASEKTAPGGMDLKVGPTEKKSATIVFGETVFPEGEIYFDKFSNQKLDVFSDKFTVYIPFQMAADMLFGHDGFNEILVDIGITGAICSETQCRPVEIALAAKVSVGSDTVTGEGKFKVPVAIKTKEIKQVPRGGSSNYPILFALGLAFLAGLSLNIMPCVWPVLPIIVMRLVEHAKQEKGKAITMGMTFCLGILLFFACLAAANIVLQVVYGTVLQWGDQFRNPEFVSFMALLLVVLALFMFGLFSFSVPSSISGKAGEGKGYAGAVGMGFLAAILSTPCSFAILAAAFAWAQSQPLGLATLGIMMIGVGMAAPYAILVAMPGLLKRTPRPGRWMELFKQGIGFILLIIAVKLLVAVPEPLRKGILYFSVVLSFCIWMWGSWVDYNTKLARKYAIRSIAVVLAIAAGFYFLKPAEKLINWQEYDTNVIEKAFSKNQPVLIKFTADWCLSCQVVEKKVYSRTDIAKLLKEKNVLAIKGDTTTKDMPATIALKDFYNEPGVPVTILHLPGKFEPVRWRGLFFADELKAQLETIP